MGRIRQIEVPPLFSESGPIQVAIFGEAPGPRGADQSGIPFWGDRAGLLVYRALVTAGLAEVPAEAWEPWDGGRFREEGLRPVPQGVLLGNAFPRCPTRDGHTFRAPTDAELKAPANLARLSGELALAAARCPGRLRVIALGRRAEWIFTRLPDPPPFDLHLLPHPSAQGLLQAAPGKGKGLKLQDLQREWETRLNALLC
jgi:hypothetical protein